MTGEVRVCAYCWASFVPRTVKQRFCSLAHQKAGRRPLEQACMTASTSAIAHGGRSTSPRVA